MWPHSSTRTPKSSNQLLLAVTQTKLCTCGGRSFSLAAPKLWNNQPHQIRSVVYWIVQKLSWFQKKKKSLYLSPSNFDPNCDFSSVVFYCHLMLYLCGLNQILIVYEYVLISFLTVQHIVNLTLGKNCWIHFFFTLPWPNPPPVVVGRGKHILQYLLSNRLSSVRYSASIFSKIISFSVFFFCMW